MIPPHSRIFIGQPLEFKEKFGLTWGNMCYIIKNLDFFQEKSS